MSLYKDIPDAQKPAFVEIINRRWGQLNGLERDWSDKAVKYLFVTNSGGAVALLNFISIKRYRVPWGQVTFRTSKS